MRLTFHSRSFRVASAVSMELAAVGVALGAANVPLPGVSRFVLAAIVALVAQVPVVRALTCGVVVSPEGLAHRGVFRTRFIRWDEISMVFPSTTGRSMFDECPVVALHERRFPGHSGMVELYALAGFSFPGPRRNARVARMARDLETYRGRWSQGSVETGG